MKLTLFERTWRGFSLIELLCLLAIIAILLSLMAAPLGKALRKARGLENHLGSLGGVEMRIEEVIASYTRYRIGHPKHGQLSLPAFIQALQLSPTAEAWLRLSCVEYRPFAAADPLTQPVIIVSPSEGSGSGINLVVFTIGDLIARP